MLNVKLDNVIKYKHHGVEHSFLEDYDAPLDENARLEQIAQLIEEKALSPQDAAAIVRSMKK